MIPAFADIQAAAARIAPHAVRTPLVESPVLSALTGGRIFLKLETLQRTGSFKFRGACNRLAMIPQGDRANGVVAFSSGNHAQGVAAAAALFGMEAVIVMPSDAPRAKIYGTRALGGTVVEYDRQREDREAIAGKLCAERGAVLVKPFDDAGVIAGQGTAGLEIAEDVAAGRDAGRCSGSLQRRRACERRGIGAQGLWFDCGRSQRGAGEFRRHETLAGSRRADRRAGRQAFHRGRADGAYARRHRV
jgi:threonine dehydratase